MSLGVLWPQSNLKVLYHLENVDDSSGNSKTLTNSSASFVTGKFGVDAKMVSSAYLHRSDACGITVRGNLTFMFWIKINTLLSSDGSLAYFLQLYENALQSISFNYYRISSTSHRLRFYAGTANAYYDTRFYTGVWYHIAGTITASSAYAMILYLNGVEVGTQTGNAGSPGTSGLNIPSGSNAFIGEVDELLIFQEVKSPQWIRQYYAWATGKMI